MKKETRYRLEGAIAALAGAVARRVPRRLMLAVGARAGAAVGRIDHRHLAITADNLQRAFPDWDGDRVRRTAHAVYRHFGRVAFDVMWLQRRSREEILDLVDIEGGGHVRTAQGRGQGVICATGHLGNWEINALCHGWAFGPVSVVGRPLDNPALDARLSAMRVQGGNTLISKHRALPHILRALRDNGTVDILMDQNVLASDGIFVEFFGRPAATTTVVAALAAKVGAAIVPAHTVLLPSGRYRAIYERPIVFEAEGGRAEAIARLTQRLTRQIEDWVRELPEQWLWMHRRWKTQPATTVDAAPNPAAEAGP
jgi:KDO2-lipid IV(A) lauroyltransferase